MRLKKETILELGKILKEDYKTELSPIDLDRLAHSLVGYFDILLKVEHRSKKAKKKKK
jgi:hypothetical protein